MDILEYTVKKIDMYGNLIATIGPMSKDKAQTLIRYKNLYNYNEQYVSEKIKI